MKINKELLPIKAHYLLRCAGTAHVIYLLPLIVREKGVSPQVLGMLWTIMLGLSLITSTLAGTLADRLKAHRAFFLISLVSLTSGIGSLILSPKIPMAGGDDDSMVTLTSTGHNNNNNTSSLLDKGGGPFTDKNYNNNINITLVDTLPRDLMIDPEMVVGEGQPVPPPAAAATGEETPPPPPPPSEEVDIPLTEFIKYPQFWLVFFALMVEQMGISMCIVIADAVCFLILGSERHKYGQQRLWGTVGMGVVGVISGAAIDFASLGQKEKNYMPALVIMLVLMTMDVVVVGRMRIPSKLEHEMKFGDVGSTLLHPQVLLFLVTVYVMGTTLGVVWVFRMMMMEDVAMDWNPQFASMKLLIGFSLFIENFGGELPFFFLSGKILRRFDHTIVLASALVAISLRCCLYYTVSNPWCFLPIELLNGVSYGLFHATMASFASRIAPPGSQATLQSIVRGLFSAGLTTAGFAGGWLYKILGGSQTFLAMGVSVAGYTVLYCILHFIISKYCTHHHHHHQEKGYEAPSSCTASSSSSSGVDPDNPEPVKEPLVKGV